jgi:hypothetical protein
MASQVQFAVGAVLVVLAAALALYQRRQDRLGAEDGLKGSSRADADYESGVGAYGSTTVGGYDDVDAVGEESRLLEPPARGSLSPYR